MVSPHKRIEILRSKEHNGLKAVRVGETVDATAMGGGAATGDGIEHNVGRVVGAAEGTVMAEGTGTGGTTDDVIKGASEEDASATGIDGFSASRSRSLDGGSCWDCCERLERRGTVGAFDRYERGPIGSRGGRQEVVVATLCAQRPLVLGFILG